MADSNIYNLLIDLRANVASLQQDMNKASQVVEQSTGKISSVVRGFFEGLGQNLARGLTSALTQPIQSIKTLDAALQQLASAGDAAGAIADNFRQLGGSASSIDAAKRAVLGTVGAFDLMRAANEGLVRGIPRLNENFAQLVQFSNQFADATGGETVPVLNELINALATGAPKALKAFGFELQANATNAQNTAAAIEQLGARMGELAPLGESVTQGQERFATAISDAFKQIGIGINESDGLTEAYNRLADAVEQIDWAAVGEGIGYAAGQIAALANTCVSALKPVTDLIANLQSLVALAKVGMLEADKAMLQARRALNVPSPQEMLASATGYDMLGSEDRRRNREAENARIDAEIKDIERRIIEAAAGPIINGALGTVLGPGRETTPITVPGVNRPSGGSSSDVDRRKREEDDLQKKRLQHEEQLAKERSDQAAALLQAQYEGQQRIIAESSGQWSDALNVVFAELGFDPQIGQQMADLGGQIVAGLFTDLEEQQDGFFGLGQTIAKGFGEAVSALFGGSGGGSGGGGGGGSWMDTLGGLFGGSGMTTQEAHAAGIQGPGMADGSFGAAGGMTYNPQGYFQAAAGVYRDVKKREELDRQYDDNRGTGAAIGGGIGAAIGSIFFMPEVGQALGSAIGGFIGRFFGRGSGNPETQARHVFANWLEKKLEEVGGVPVYRDGRFERLTNFVEGPRNRFNRPGWGEELMAKPNAGAFVGLGDAFRAMLGIKQDIGGQIGAMLFDNMGGDIDNLRMAVKRLGLSFKDVEKAMVELGNRGEKTWLEVESALVGAEEAFKDGLAGVGDFNKAMQMLLDSGARGFEAVQSVRNIAIEAREAGITNFEQLREHLLKTFDPAVVDAFFASLQARQIDSIEELAGLTDREAGQVVADMQAAGVQFKETGEELSGVTQEASAKVNEATKAIRELTAAVRDIDVGGKSAPVEAEEEPEGEEKAFARGGVITRPTRALMGEGGPEAVLPLSRKNGRLGVALNDIQGGWGNGGMVVNIDARGATPGTENQIRSAMREMADQITSRVYRSLSYQRGRAT